MPLIPKGTARIDARDGAYAAALLSDTGGLTQFGGFIETLLPGSASSTLHWHEKEDEMVHVLTGTVTLFASEAQTPMYPGDTACFKAAPPVGHCMRNDSDPSASYMVVSTRSGNDDVTYQLTGDTLTIRDGIKTYRDANGTVTRTTTISRRMTMPPPPKATG
jgi:uncharacterized cupin superfamily protein